MPSQKYFLEKGLPHDAYVQFAYKTAMALGADSVGARKDMQDVVEFEVRLANVSMILLVQRGLNH